MWVAEKLAATLFFTSNRVHFLTWDSVSDGRYVLRVESRVRDDSLKVEDAWGRYNGPERGRRWDGDRNDDEGDAGKEDEGDGHRNARSKAGLL